MDKKKKDRLTWIAYIAIFILFWITEWHKPLVSKLQQGILATGIIQADLNQEPSEIKVDAILFDEQGQKVRLSEFSNEVVFFNVWATWCPPCKAEMPGIQSLFESTDKEAVNFVMLSTDKHFEDAKQFKATHAYTFPIYRLGEILSEELNSSSLPTTYIIGKSGTIEMVHEGMAQYDTEKFKDYLQELVLEN